MIGQWITRLREFGLEVAANRYYSKYVGRVTRNNDNQQQGRVKLTCPSLGRPTEMLNWAYPSSPFAGDNYGFYFPPEEGDSVWVWFENGDVQSPNYSGSWFLNKDPNRLSVSSQVPAEFREAPPDYIPTKRGIKTKRGHGLIFEDDPTKAHVEIWSGEATTPGQSATRNNRVRLDDRNQQIVVFTQNGHFTDWRYATGHVRVETGSAGGHRFVLDDTGQNARLVSKGGHQIKLDDQSNLVEIRSDGGHIVRLQDNAKRIEVTSKSGHQVVLDDTTQRILLRSKGLREITLDDLAQRTVVQNKIGQSIFMDAAGTTLTEPAVVTVNAAGAIALNGKGVVVSSTGGGAMSNTGSGIVNNSFTGLVTENYNGGWTMIVVGALNIASAVLSVVGSSVGLGTGSRFRLVDERFFTAFMAHTHNVTVVGAPTGPPITGIPSPGAHTTTNTTAS